MYVCMCQSVVLRWSVIGDGDGVGLVDWWWGRVEWRFC